MRRVKGRSARPSQTAGTIQGKGCVFMSKQDISRRGFLGGAAAALGTAALGGGALLAGCAPKTAGEAEATAGGGSGEPAQWDYEADVVVVGSGLGAWAALKAATEGASVIVLEKGAWGGSAGVSEGTYWLPTHPMERPAGYEDTPEEALEFMRNICEGRPDDLAVKFLDTCPEFYDWSVNELDIEWEFYNFAASSYYDVSGSKPYGRALMFSDAMLGLDKNTFPSRGSGTHAHLKKKAEELGVQIMLDTPAVHLVTSDAGEVVGVVAQEGSKDVYVHALKGVILMAGGFEHNQQMREAYFKMPAYNTLIVPNATGDGIVMGQEVGAALEGMSTYMTAQFFAPDWDDSKKFNPDFAQRLEYAAYDGPQGKPGAILVNRQGKRFCNDAAGYGTFPRAYDSYDANTYTHFPNIPSFFICDSRLYQTYKHEVPEWMTTADTLDELAEKLGIDREGFAEEVARFNENAAQGIDPDFGRGSHPNEVCWGDFLGLYGDIPNPNLAPVEVPPFYGCVMVPGTNGCNGGLKINDKAQVLRPDGTPIPRLYSAGTNAVHVGGPSYAAGGVSLGSGSVMGYVAAKEVVALESL